MNDVGRIQFGNSEPSPPSPGPGADTSRLRETLFTVMADLDTVKEALSKLLTMDDVAEMRALVRMVIKEVE